jgi:hypothetical protein
MNLLKEVYVASFGSDETGDGSKENPFATLQHGIDMAENKAEVCIEPDTSILGVDFRNKQFSFRHSSK